MRARAVLLAAACVVAGCHRGTPATSTAPAADAEGPVADARTAAQPAVVPARCKAVDPGLVVDEASARARDGTLAGTDVGGPELEIGDAVDLPSGMAVGIVHRTAAGRVAAVALLPPDGASVRVYDLGPTLGDAPPPRLAVRGATLLAVAYGIAKRPGARAIDVYTVSAAGDVALTGTLDEAPDDSLVVDVSPDRVVWDEAAAGPSPGAGGAAASRVPRGVIRIAEISADGRPSAARDVSPATSDADTPRIVADGGKTLVFWIARKPEPARSADASSAGDEVAGEPRAYAWLEVARLDGAGGGASGSASGSAGGAGAVPPGAPPVGGASSVRRLTSMTGHASAYDVAVIGGGGASTGGGGGPRGVVVVARDEGEAVDGSGGSLLRVRVGPGDAPPDPPLAFPGDDLGRGAPEFVEGDALWLAWTGPREEGRLLPLDAAAMPVGIPSLEALLDDGRPLLSRPASPPAGSAHRLLVATPGDPAAQLRMLACSR